MPIAIDPNTLYTISDIRTMFDVTEQWLLDAMASPVQRLEAARIGGIVFVRGDHLLKFLATLIPDSPTALHDESDEIDRHDEDADAPEPTGAVGGGLMKTGDFEDPGAPKILGGQVRSGTLRHPDGPARGAKSAPAGQQKQAVPPAQEQPPARPAAPAASDASPQQEPPKRDITGNFNLDDLLKEAEEISRRRDSGEIEQVQSKSAEDSGSMDQWL